LAAAVNRAEYQTAPFGCGRRPRYVWLKEKVEKDGWLEDEDLLRLCFLPLMKSKLNEAEMTMRAAELAEVIPGETGAFVQGVLLALSDRVVAANDFANQ